MAVGKAPIFRGWITACVPHYKCRRYIRRSVEGLLAQTYPWIRVVVINDGDPAPPWPELGDITDRRLLRFSLASQSGPYFALEAARRASPDPFFLIQDADDWSRPDRAQTLLEGLLAAQADFAVSAQPQFGEDAMGAVLPGATQWDSVCASGQGRLFQINTAITPQFVYRAPHHGLFRRDFLERVGGYYGGFRISWDKMLTNLVLMIGKLHWTSAPLYHRLVRGDSLTHATDTGYRSNYHRTVNLKLARTYEAIYRDCERHRRGELSFPALEAAVRRHCAAHVRPAEASTLSREAARLSMAMDEAAR